MGLFCQSPIVLVGDVGNSHANIFVSCLGKEKIVKLSSDYDVQIEDLLQKVESPYSAYLLKINNLSENTEYEISVQVGCDTIPVHLKTNTTHNTLNFLVGSCNLHSLGLINSPEPVFKNLDKIRKSNDVDMMLHLGDQIYSDIPNPWFKPTLDFFIRKYFDAWSDCKSANKFLASLSNYMTLDDHEIINNYRNRSDREKYSEGVFAYNIFQRSHSPNKDTPHYTFEKNGYPFFVMDGRLTRDKTKIICEAQENALYEWLNKHKNSNKFMFIATSVPFLVDMSNAEGDKWCTNKFKHQRNRILSYIVSNNINNVIFLSGDVHCSLFSKAIFQRESSSELIPIYELTSSPLNQIQKESINKFNIYHKISLNNASGYVNIHKHYDSHSNVALLKVTDSKLTYEYYRTQTGEKVLTGIVNLKV